MTGTLIPRRRDTAASCQALALGRKYSGRDKLQRHAVDAVPLTGWRRTIIEDVTKMSTTAPTMHFRARITDQVVSLCAHAIVERLPETWPAGSTIVLGLGAVQRQVTARANMAPSVRIHIL